VSPSHSPPRTSRTSPPLSLKSSDGVRTNQDRPNTPPTSRANKREDGGSWSSVAPSSSAFGAYEGPIQTDPPPATAGGRPTVGGARSPNAGSPPHTSENTSDSPPVASKLTQGYPHRITPDAGSENVSSTPPVTVDRPMNIPLSSSQTQAPTPSHSPPHGQGSSSFSSQPDAPVVLPPPPPPSAPAPPPALTPQTIARAQKHCRFAISALDYEDAAQAIKELRAALDVLGG
jgi:vacuolar protein sorting-associated protein VTA1